MKTVFLSALLCISFLASGQLSPDAKRDYNWVISNYGTPIKTLGLNFNTNPILFYYFNHNIQFSRTNTAISDTIGQLLCFSNGMRIEDRNGNIMPHGDSLNYWANWERCEHMLQIGFEEFNGAILLPDPNKNKPNLYYYFANKVDWDFSTNQRISDGLRMSIIDMDLNNGLGDISIKEQTLISDTLTYGGITAVRHGNGRDWWIIVPTMDNKSYYRILLNPEGPEVLPKQTIGNIPVTGIFTWTIVCFSPDGQWYARYSGDKFGEYYINLFKFDRCTGNLTSMTDLSYNAPTGGGWMAFSPTSKILYHVTQEEVFQYNLDTLNIPASKKLVANYVPSGGVYGWDYFGEGVQLGPDNKIYIGASQTKYLHVINKPDQPGSACEFVQRGLQLPQRNAFGGFTHSPNFRLGRWEGSECDNVYNGIEEVESPVVLNAFPNPASQILNLDMSVIQLTENAQLQIIDALGRLVEQHTLTPYQAVLNIDVSFWASGIYSCQVRQKGQWIATARFAVSP